MANISLSAATKNNTTSSFTYEAARNVSISWSVAPVISLVTLTVGVTGNGGLIVLFIHDRATLITPFNVYVLNLMVANLLHLINVYPLDVIVGLYSGTWVLGRSACAFFLYGVWLPGCASSVAHSLIAVNRIWAVIFPHSYRTQHGMRAAVMVCLSMWAIIYSVTLPWLVLDQVLYRIPVENGPAECSVNQSAQFAYSMVIEFTLFNFPLIATVLALPVILYATWRNRRLNARRVGNTISRGGHPLRTLAQSATDAEHEPNSSAVVPSVKRIARPKSNATLLLVLLTVSLMVTYVPTSAIYTAAAFLPDYDWTEAYLETAVTAPFQPAIDPILFALALTNVRTALVNVLTRSHPRGRT
ncbi:hypothetical protein BV898_10899 [Hypsibius exemplaris]|uniref:G-protein coupled receptors family 1 profile domain-containing protein n=1 Tax=Hypsibius exemplaris TaxID=2072580 RepID=A0A1W0WI55_HYPEX|nr:hypothetical protein BV898_10899 [Hypsibius exemplaris]